jgi:hypothetical protein
MTANLNWRGDEVFAKIAQGAVDAITEIDQQIETRAKAELYPGHGKKSGTLQRAIQGDTGRIEGNYARGKVGVKGVPYSLRIHKLYEYIYTGLKEVKPRAVAILSKHVKKK